MNTGGLENQELSEDKTSGDERLVPVGEAIRYRRRAQNAESQISELSDELKNVNSQNQRLTAEVENLRMENDLVSKLVSAGANDIEAVLLLAKKRLQAEDGKDIDAVVKQLLDEKEHLFVRHSVPVIASRTAGVKDRGESSRSGLERAAKKAVSSGNRIDVQEYMRARRGCL